MSNDFFQTINQPLSDAEYQELEDFLTSDAVPDDCMDLSTLNGFLTALLVGPVPLPPSLWLPAVWGEEEGQEMAFESADQASRIVSLIMRMYNTIARQLQAAPREFAPLLYQSEVDGEPVPVLEGWCMGFMEGVHHGGSAWMPLAESETAKALTPMLLFGTEEGLKELKAGADQAAEQRREWANLLGYCVAMIDDFWLPYRRQEMAATQPVRAVPKAGRNDPCPCGSGKKFKKCCGANPPPAR
ncbi:MAG: UPF0149 family protein [Pseudomonadota bacterium]|nr:UPF0149 family protein [Pseudomonadota bacterium]